MFWTFGGRAMCMESSRGERVSKQWLISTTSRHGALFWIKNVSQHSLSHSFNSVLLSTSPWERVSGSSAAMLSWSGLIFCVSYSRFIRQLAWKHLPEADDQSLWARNPKHQLKDSKILLYWGSSLGFVHIKVSISAVLNSQIVNFFPADTSLVSCFSLPRLIWKRDT